MAASISFGTVTQDSNAFYTGAQRVGIWTDTFITNHYENDRHRYYLGVTSPGGFQGKSTAFVQTANPTLLWICDWTVERWGTQPQVPNPTSLDTDWVLLDDWWEPETVVIGGADGRTPLYRISGTYIYGHKNPSDNTNLDIAFPLAPWIKQSKFPATARSLGNSFLTQGISDTSATIGKGIL